MPDYRILLADDELALRFLLTETLADEGYAITETEDGKEALEHIRNRRYDLIILDYMMPEYTGVEVCEWMRKEPNPNQNTPVVLLTAKALEKDREKAKSAGVTAYIVKPFSPLQLVDTVGQLIEGGQ
ncbi:response regulator [Paenibacillus doosanensis]|uniref:Transcriptional regulatory protein SrrA n=1 Tax=Paenibacillus konkukensis TaxID=2020716 RepID=A0ABY4RV83_9BACL|nr:MULTISPECIES: response regulator [Paenibacillus]MCS7460748.1 response regulator [Paenibacillus doosanensis]UQZ85928.1 Transcriptional regulatory protein SrrA [Paenibacillus konkukensis]